MRLADSISLRSRRRKLALFLETMRPTAETTVLDIGVDDFGFGEVGRQRARELRHPQLLRAGLSLARADHGARPARGRRPSPRAIRPIRYVQGNASELPFEDSSFDVVFSNAVIEHVGDAEAQRRFVAEALRVAPRAFITTPNRWFPVEVHTRLPLVHWLPADARSSRRTSSPRKPWAKENRLLGPGDLEELFPDGTRIVNLGMTLAAIVG